MVAYLRRDAHALACGFQRLPDTADGNDWAVSPLRLGLLKDLAKLLRHGAFVSVLLPLYALVVNHVAIPVDVLPSYRRGRRDTAPRFGQQVEEQARLRAGVVNGPSDRNHLILRRKREGLDTHWQVLHATKWADPPQHPASIGKV